MARRNIHLPVAVESHRGGVQDVAEKGLDCVVGVDLENRYRNLLTARSGKSGVDIAFAIKHGVGDGIQVVGDGDRNLDGVRVADMAIGSSAVRAHGDRTGGCAIGHARYEEIVGTDKDCAFDLAEMHAGPAQLVGTKALSRNSNLPSGQRERRGDGLDVRLAVDVLFSQQTIGDAHEMASATRLEV